MADNQKIVYITRRERFNAAHKLYNPNWTEQENEDFFGKCSNKYYHGHNFDLFVTVKGIASAETGMVIDLKLLKKIINIALHPASLSDGLQKYLKYFVLDRNFTEEIPDLSSR